MMGLAKEGAPSTEPCTGSFIGVGARLGQYVLLRELGSGGMGRVFEATHVQLGSRVAIKILRQAVATPEAMRRFLREGRACSRIRHPHVVQVLDIGAQDGQPFLVMELIDGVDLEELVRRKERPKVAELAEVFLPLCSAIWAAHQTGVVHRDLKPTNVILTRVRTNVVHPVIVDFGVSKLLFSESAEDLTKTGSLVGTAAYLAPEQARGTPNADPASDQYALGVMLYECATGCRPFTGDSQYDLIHSILHATLFPPSSRNPDLPPEFDELVLRAMSREPSKRYPSVHALGVALLSFANARSWALWGSEFCGTAGGAGGTAADEAPSVIALPGGLSRPDSLTNTGSAGASRWPWVSRRFRLVAAPLALAAAVLAFVMIASKPIPPHASPAPSSVPLGAAQPRPATERSALPNHGQSASVPEPPAVSRLVASTTPALLPRKHAPGDVGATPAANTPGARAAPRPARPHRTGFSKKPPGDAAERATPSVQRGTNGALILE